MTYLSLKGILKLGRGDDWGGRASTGWGGKRSEGETVAKLFSCWRKRRR